LFREIVAASSINLHAGRSKSLCVAVDVSWPFDLGLKRIVASHLDNASNHHFEQDLLSARPLPEVQWGIFKAISQQMSTI
jgi:hypothetical protein